MELQSPMPFSNTVWQECQGSFQKYQDLQGPWGFGVYYANYVVTNPCSMYNIYYKWKFSCVVILLF